MSSTAKSPTMSIDTLAIEYITGRRARRVTGYKAWMNERVTLHDFAHHCTRGVTIHAVESWVASHPGWADSTLALRWRLVRAFCRWLHSEGHIKRDPMRGLRAPKVARRQPRALNPDQVAALITACPDRRAVAIVALMVGCGLRRCEVAGLRHEHWDHHGHVITVTGKFGNERTVPLVTEAETALIGYLAEHPSHAGPILRSYNDPTRGLIATSIGKIFTDIANRSGVKLRAWDGVGCHSLRHTCASDVLERDGNVHVVQQILGHRDLSSTQIYLRRVQLDRMRTAMEGRTYTAA